MTRESRNPWYSTLLVSLVVVAASCSAPAASTSAPETVDGEELFSLKAVGPKPGCVTCHSLVPERRLVGPSLADVGARAAGRVPDTTAEEYLRQSIVDPGAHVVDGFVGTSMPNGYGDVLSEQQIAAVVDYLLEPK